MALNFRLDAWVLVIPAQAGIHFDLDLASKSTMDSGLRRNDGADPVVPTLKFTVTARGRG
jgi:hypothetical protein